MRCHWHVSGALLLIPGDGAAYDQNFDSLLAGAHALDPPTGAGEPIGGFAAFSAPVGPICWSPDEYFRAGNPAEAPAEPDWYGPDNGDDFAGAGPDAAEATDAGDLMECCNPLNGDAAPASVGEDAGAIAAPAQDDEAQREEIEAGRRSLRGRKKREDEEEGKPGTPAVPVHDEYAELDPHCDEPGENKPYTEMTHRPARCVLDACKYRKRD
jgi:hypothetical protein